jgi:O6-methylguanine-DNA--protein-cysteine methyltransferase
MRLFIAIELPAFDITVQGVGRFQRRRLSYLQQHTYGRRARYTRMVC